MKDPRNEVLINFKALISARSSLKYTSKYVPHTNSFYVFRENFPITVV